MAPSHSFWLFLSLVLCHFCDLVPAAPWIVTQAFEKVTTTDSFYPYHPITETYVQEITPTATSLPEALSTSTSTADDSYYYQKGITVVQKLYPTGVGSPHSYTYDYDYDDNYFYTSISTVYKVILTYSADSDCSTQLTTTTAAEVSPPRVVRTLLPRTSTTTSVSVDDSVPFSPTTITYDVVYVDPTQLPSTSLHRIHSANLPRVFYDSGCDASSNIDNGSSSSSDSSSDSPSPPYYDPDYNATSNTYSSSNYRGDDFDYSTYNWFTQVDPYWMAISPLALTLILICTWIPLVLAIGILEAYFRFRRLMTGWQTRRGLPVAWSFVLLPISLFLLMFFKKGFRARSDEDAKVMRARWEEMSFGTKMALFWRWGFRYKYPVEVLGGPPERVEASKRPVEGQVGADGNGVVRGEAAAEPGSGEQRAGGHGHGHGQGQGQDHIGRAQ